MGAFAPSLRRALWLMVALIEFAILAALLGQVIAQYAH